MMDVQRVTLATAFLARIFQVVVILVFQIQIRGAERHGAIHVYRKPRNALLILELAQVIH